MWAFVLRMFGFPGRSAPRPVPVKARAIAGENWNGTILSGETYR